MLYRRYDMEIEIKLSPVLPFEAKAVFEKETFFEGTPETVRMKAVYYDTPDKALLKSGFSFRERLEDERRVFCLKGKRRGNARLEAEAEASSFAEGARAVCLKEGVPQEIAPVLKSEKLIPLFETLFVRKRAVARWKNSLIEISFDTGEVSREDRFSAISELELELKEGNEQDLKDLSLYLKNKYGFKESYGTKAARGALLTKEEFLKMREVSPFFIGSEMLNYCINKGWLRYELNEGRLRYYLTPEGKEEMEKNFGIDFSKPCAEVK